MSSGFDFLSKAVEVAQANAWPVAATASPRRKIISVSAKDWYRAAELLEEAGGVYLIFISAMKLKNKLFVLAEIKSVTMDCISLRTEINAGDKLGSLNVIWPQADWHEQEVFESFQVEIEGVSRNKKLFRREEKPLEH